MNPVVLFLITSDPRTSARPAEAIRIAAGVGTWKRVEITLYLREAAVLALSEFPEELIDEDNFIRYLPMLGEFRRPIYVQSCSPFLAQLGRAALPYAELTDRDLADLASKAQYVARF